MYASITNYQYSSSLSAVSAEGFMPSSAQNLLSADQQGTDMSGYPYASRGDDILDIQQNLMQQMQDAATDLAKAVAQSPQSVAEELAAFQEKVGDIFEQLMEQIGAMVMEGDLSGMSDKVNGAGQSYFALQMSVSIEVKITIAQQPQAEDQDLAQQAISAVSKGAISRQDKNDLLKIIAMVDEFVRTDTRENVLRSVIRLVPLMENITSPSMIDKSITSAAQGEAYYSDLREVMRASVGPIGQMMHEEREADNRGGVAYTASLSYVQQSEVYFRTTA
jgi:hypothetical protein